MSKPTYTVAEVAERYGVQPAAVLGWIQSGELRAVSVGRRGAKRPTWRITAEALAAFEADRTTQPPTVTRRRKRSAGSDYIEFY